MVACMALRSVLLSSFVLTVNAAETLAEVRARAERGDVSAMKELALRHATGAEVANDDFEAARWYKKAAESGDAGAQFALGFMYASGQGVAKDTEVAEKWFCAAAEQGDALYQRELGEMYATGRGVSKDSAKAGHWLARWATQGSAGNQLELGGRYEDGFGVAKNLDEAERWYQKASDQGDAGGKEALRLLYRRRAVEAKDTLGEIHWFFKAAELGDVTSQVALGVIYSRGKITEKNSNDAVRWFRIAAEQGNDTAQTNLGIMFAAGDGVAKNPVEAVKWYRKAALQGNAQAQGNLGAMYANGEGVPKDTIEGLAWTYIGAASDSEAFAANASLLERRFGPEVALAAQRRSKEIQIEIEARNRPSVAVAPKDAPPTGASPAVKPKASGSGAIISSDGHVLTAAHVVAAGSRVKILTEQGIKAASVVRIDEANDLAVLKLTAGTYSALPVSSSRNVRLGQSVATIGFPNIEIQGFSPKVTRGEISSLNGLGDDPRAWQISAPVQSGNSGGALLDENGNLIGVVVSKLGMKAFKATGDLPQNVSYAVKSHFARALIEPFLNVGAPEPKTSATKPLFEDMIAKAQQAVVLILVY